MKKLKWLAKSILPIIALAIGLGIGFGESSIRIKKERQAFEDVIKKEKKKFALLQKKMEEEKSRVTASMEEQCKGDIDRLNGEKKALGAQLGKLKEQAQRLEAKARESDEAFAGARKDKKESEEALAKAKKEIQETQSNNRDLEGRLKKTTAEMRALQAELKKTGHALDLSESNNARLCVIAEELVEKYRNKGLGTVLMEKEPLTQFRKIEFEQLIQNYQERIQTQKIKKNDVGRK